MRLKTSMKIMDFHLTIDRKEACKYREIPIKIRSIKKRTFKIKLQVNNIKGRVIWKHRKNIFKNYLIENHFLLDYLYELNCYLVFDNFLVLEENWLAHFWIQGNKNIQKLSNRMDISV